MHYWNAPVPGWHQGWVKLKQSKKSNKFYGSYKVVYPGATRRQDRECYQELALGNYGAAGGGAQTWVIIITSAALNRGKEGRGKEGGNREENGIEPRSLLAQFLGL